MKLTHTGNHRLSTLLICTNSKCRIFLCQLGKTIAKFVKVFLSFRLNCDTNHRIGELDRFKHNRSALLHKCITGANILETNSRTNITRTNHLNRILMIRVHLEQTAHTLFLARAYIIYIRTGLNLTRINTEENKTAYIRVGCNLKGKSRSFIVF